MSDEIKICTRCIMDTAAPKIKFDETGRCNYCTEYIALINEAERNQTQKEKGLIGLIDRIKKEGRNKEYDCIVGVSGGLDSSYVLYISKKLGLRALAVHMDNGWNSELAVSNIEKLCRNLNVDLYTCVLDWETFKNLQIAFFKANVIDIEMLTDHAIAATLYEIALKRKIKYILAGTNLANEGMRMPPGWTHFKRDLWNIKGIYKKFGDSKRIKNFPTIGITKTLKYMFVNRIKWISILNYVTYNKEEAIAMLNNEIGWRPYEKKHYESVFTRFYQGYILPTKFGVDKRKLHYSTLICSGQISRDEAMELMKNPPYENNQLLQEDKNFVLKKLGFTSGEFENYLHAPPVSHTHYPSNKWIYGLLLKAQRFMRSFLRRNTNYTHILSSR